MNSTPLANQVFRMASTTPTYNGPRAMRQRGHTQYDAAIRRLIIGVRDNMSREELLREMLDEFQGLTLADSVVVLGWESWEEDGNRVSRVVAADQLGVQDRRWRDFVTSNHRDIDEDSVIHQVIEDGLLIDVWSTEYYASEFRVFHSLFDVHSDGWILGIQLPRGTVRHPNLGVFCWYQTGKGAEKPPSGAEQDLRFLCVFQHCYDMASFQLRKNAREILAQRKDLLTVLTRSVVTHEVHQNVTVVFDSCLYLLRDMKKLQNRLKGGEAVDPVQGIQEIGEWITTTITPQLRHLRAVSDAILAMTKRKSLKCEPVLLESLACDIANLMRSRLDKYCVTIAIEPESSYLSISTDRTLLLQLLLNLVQNSVTALAHGSTYDDQPRGVSIRFSEEPSDADRPIHIEVRDNGPGVPRELRERIFEAGFTTDTGGDGHGMGLHICRNIAGYLGGELDLRRSARPTIFLLSMPRETVLTADLEDELHE